MKKMLAGSLMLLLLPFSAHAEFSPFLGIYGGHGQTRNTPSGIDNKDGSILGIKGIGSFRTDSWYFDGALGYQGENLYGGSQETDTRSGIAELDARARMGEHWSLGPVAAIQFGTDNYRSLPNRGDNGFVTGGLKLMMENVMGHETPYRIELSVQRSLTAIQGDYYEATIGFQIGFPWYKKETPVLYVPPLVEKTEIIHETTVVVVQEKPEEKEVVVRLHNKQVGFVTNSAELDPRSRRRLKALGKYLADHKDMYSAIHISGHTDNRGSLKLNQKLSERRAESVRKVFAQQGVDESMMTSEGKNFSMPIAEGNTPEAWDKNRRTEIKFEGVSDKKQFNHDLEDIMK